jgi:hypothetical protein
VIEALLLWALSRNKVAALAAATAPRGRPSIDDWRLADMIKVAKELKLIGQKTASQADLARDFRNLIHPAVAERTAMKCDRPTAFGAFAGMDLVASDLEAHFTPKAAAP